jgi:hypothetical protein
MDQEWIGEIALPVLGENGARHTLLKCPEKKTWKQEFCM